MAERYNADEVQALADDFIRFKRYVEDVLENLPDMGMTESSVKKLIAKYGETSSAGFEAFADADKAIAEMFAKYEAESAMTIASIKATSDTNKADIALLSSRVDGAGASIAGIQQQADANGAFINMFAVASPFDIDASKGYTYDEATNKYIFKNSNDENVDVYPEDFAGIYINAMNNNYSEIQLNAKVVRFGDYASVDDSGNLKVKRLYHSSGEQFYAQLGNNTGSFADFGVYDEINNKWAWRFYNDDMATEVIHLRIYENNIFGYNGKENKTFPKGEWDFSSCKVSNIPLYFS